MVRINKDSAVSPVVGVMLMIVITVIIAAVVSLFASGIVDVSSSSAQEAQVKFVGLYTAGYTESSVSTIAKNTYPSEAGGLLFKVVGDKPLDLTKLKLDLASYIGGGGFVSLTYDDPVSTAYLPPNAETGRVAGNYWKRTQLIMPPLYMEGHRVIIFGYSGGDPELASDADKRMFAETAEPGDMFLFVPEYLNPAQLSLAIGLRVDDRNGNTIVSGGMSADGGTTLTLSNKDTGYVYYSDVLLASDLIATAY